jgi:flagellar FliJ protein
MKKKSSRLRPVEKLAEDKAKSATEDMVSARNSHQSHEQKLSELIQYRSEYIEQFQTRAKVGMQAAQLQQYQQFISQLDVAIKQQKNIVSQASEILDHSQNQWKDKNSHKKAINKAVGRFKKKEFNTIEKNEQNEQDEQNTQRHNYNKT